MISFRGLFVFSLKHNREQASMVGQKFENHYCNGAIVLYKVKNVDCPALEGNSMGLHLRLISIEAVYV